MAAAVVDEKRMAARVTQFDSLYEDVLLKILSYLDRASLISVAQTCEAMKVTSYHPSLWKDCTIAYRAIGEHVHHNYGYINSVCVPHRGLMLSYMSADAIVHGILG